MLMHAWLLILWIILKCDNHLNYREIHRKTRIGIDWIELGNQWLDRHWKLHQLFLNLFVLSFETEWWLAFIQCVWALDLSQHSQILVWSTIMILKYLAKMAKLTCQLMYNICMIPFFVRINGTTTWGYTFSEHCAVSTQRIRLVFNRTSVPPSDN